MENSFVQKLDKEYFYLVLNYYFIKNKISTSFNYYKYMNNAV